MIYRIVPDLGYYGGDSNHCYVIIERKVWWGWKRCGKIANREVAIKQIGHWLSPPEIITTESLMNTIHVDKTKRI